ncbi:MAG: type II toxin-antitoxin system Phd/YefM family antitoxin [Rhodospirillales bacterium]
MLVLGITQLRTRLFRLLGRVGAGETVLITRRGKPLARLEPVRQFDRDRAAAAVETLKRLRRGNNLAGIDWRTLRDAGRR